MKILCVLRHVGERTLAECRKRAEAQCDAVEEVSMSPFLAAVRRTFEIGAASKADFLLGLDADVLLDADAIKRMLVEVNKHPEAPLKIDFRLRDKFRGPSYGGCHLYWNCYSKDVLRLMDSGEAIPSETRPESSTVAAAGKLLGLRKRILSKKKPVGLHDFEQFFSHIYAKWYNRGIKDRKWVGKLVGCFKEERMRDDDFKIAYEGFVAGQATDAAMCLDVRRYPDATEAMKKHGLSEKGPLKWE